MPKRSLIRITKSKIDSLSAGQTIWDSDVAGFGIAANQHSKTFKLKYYHKGRQRWLTIGEYGPLTAEEARKQALAYKAKIQAGFDPAAERKAVAITIGNCPPYSRSNAVASLRIM